MGFVLTGNAYSDDQKQTRILLVVARDSEAQPVISSLNYQRYKRKTHSRTIPQ